jgi:hypothetical protein
MAPVVKTGPDNYPRVMFKPFEFCVPTKATDAKPDKRGPYKKRMVV